MTLTQTRGRASKSQQFLDVERRGDGHSNAPPFLGTPFIREVNVQERELLDLNE